MPSFADCTGGEVIKGKNGTSYCLSKIGVNWWSAFAWCESQGMKLASMDFMLLLLEGLKKFMNKFVQTF